MIVVLEKNVVVIVVVVVVVVVVVIAFVVVLVGVVVAPANIFKIFKSGHENKRQSWAHEHARTHTHIA